MLFVSKVENEVVLWVHIIHQKDDAVVKVVQRKKYVFATPSGKWFHMWHNHLYVKFPGVQQDLHDQSLCIIL